jgi:hypothetical protein
MARPPATRVASLLTQICLSRGWCLGPVGDAIVRDALGDGLDAVVDALISEELELPDPAQCDGATRQWLSESVDDWLFAPRGRGATSGLPL